MTRRFLIAITLVLSLPAAAFADDSMDDIENLFSKDEKEATAPTQREAAQPKAAEIKDVKDLDKLSEFKDIAVIQRRYLPKTGRFEIFGGPAVVLNDKFFLNVGLSARFAYYFREAYGLEFIGLGLNTSERSLTTELRDNLKVITKSFVTPRTFVGLDFKWSPIYGKMTWRNHHITPFDMYFSLGGGMTGTNQGGNEPTVHIGTGQVYALTQSTAIRWDFSWNFYSAKSTTTGVETSGNYNNLFITVGMSYFFPEANYR